MESVRYLLGRTFSKCQESIDSEWALHSLDSGETQPWASYIPWRVGTSGCPRKICLISSAALFAVHRLNAVSCIMVMSSEIAATTPCAFIRWFITTPDLWTKRSFRCALTRGFDD